MGNARRRWASVRVHAPFCHPASRGEARGWLHMLRVTTPKCGASGNTGPIVVIAGVRIGAASAN